MTPVRVLLVEDDLRVARVNRDLLERDPQVHVVGSAATLAQARALVPALSPDLILLDVHLPDGSGLALLQEWRAGGLTTDVALITAADDEASVRSALAGGAGGSSSATGEKLTPFGVSPTGTVATTLSESRSRTATVSAYRLVT